MRARQRKSSQGPSSHDVVKRCEGSQGPEPKEKTSLRARVRAMANECCRLRAWVNAAAWCWSLGGEAKTPTRGAESRAVCGARRRAQSCRIPLGTMQFVGTWRAPAANETTTQTRAYGLRP